MTDLSKYHIDIDIDERIFRWLAKDAADCAEEGDTESAEEYLEDLKFLKSIEGGVEVSTLAEYFELLDHIAEAWDEYRVYNEGQFIMVGES